MRRESLKLTVTVSAGGLQAVAEPTGKGLEKPPERLEDVQRELAEAGIAFGVKPEACARVFEALRSKQAGAFPIVVAEGLAPQPGVAATTQMHVVEHELVRRGQTLATLDGGNAPAPGRTVRGEEVPPPQTPGLQLVAGRNVRYSQETRTFSAVVCGYVQLGHNVLHVEPLVRISDDQMRADVLARPLPAGKAAFDEAALVELLREEQVVFGLETGNLERVARIMASPGSAEATLHVAAGRPPAAGTDAAIHHAVGAEQQIGKLREDGGIDFHQRSIVTAVSAEQLLAIKTPATAGEAGQTVTGKALAAVEGKDCAIEAGANVRVSEDGLRFLAAAAGILHWQGNKLEVTEVFAVEGDTDMSTGDIDCPCNVAVRGTVRATFAVKAGGSVQIGASVEDAIVEAGGSAEIKGGIIHHVVGSLVAKGDVKAAYAQNAHIRAGGSVLLGHALNSIVTAGQDVLVMDRKGVILGGHVVAGRHVQARIAGSSAGVRTLIQAGVDYQALAAVDEQLAQIQRQKAGILMAAGERFLPLVEPGRPAPRDATLRERIEQWRTCEKQVAELREKRCHLLESGAHGPEAAPCVTILGTVFTGVEIRIGDATLTIQEPLRGGRFTRDPDTRTIKTESANG